MPSGTRIAALAVLNVGAVTFFRDAVTAFLSVGSTQNGVLPFCPFCSSACATAGCAGFT